MNSEPLSLSSPRIGNGMHRAMSSRAASTPAQMGRCQGGFCTYKIIKIIMRETGMGYDEVTKRGPGSRVLKGEL